MPDQQKTKPMPTDSDLKRTENLLLDQLIQRNPERAQRIIERIRRSMAAEQAEKEVQAEGDLR